MTINNKLDRIWLYSNYYGDLIYSITRLNNIRENYSALVILFNTMELIFKSVRENFNQNFNQDLYYLKEKFLLTENEYLFLNSRESGMRKIRNIMMHKDAYEYFIEDNNGIMLPLVEKETWEYIYNLYFPRIINIIDSVIKKSNK